MKIIKSKKINYFRNAHTSIIIFICLFFISSTGIAQGQYTQIGHTRLYSEYYLNPKAPFKGSIIFQNGSGTDLTEWTQNKTFLDCVRKLGNIFLYDRSGLGKSPADLSMSLKNPMTAKLINTKLTILLKKRHIKLPYILVAHSYGAMYAGYFARKYPRLVKGIILIDPVPPRYQWSSDFLISHNTTVSEFERMKKMKARELYKQYSFAITNKNNKMSAQLFYQLLGFQKTIKQLQTLPALSNKIPVVIISSTYMEKNAPIKGDWYKQQKKWLNKNARSKIIQVKSGHFIQLQHPNLVCKKIKELIQFEYQPAATKNN